MKTIWNSLLIALSLLLSSASMILAEPATIEHSAPIEDYLATEPKKSPEELARYQKLVEADRLYLTGDRIAALNLYRQVKTPNAFNLRIAIKTRTNPQSKYPTQFYPTAFN
jgi:hypothetical protein